MSISKIFNICYRIRIIGFIILVWILVLNIHYITILYSYTIEIFILYLTRWRILHFKFIIQIIALTHSIIQSIICIVSIFIIYIVTNICKFIKILLIFDISYRIIIVVLTEDSVYTPS